MSRIVAALAALLFLVLMGCGGGDDPDEPPTAPSTIAVGGVLDAFPATGSSATTDPRPTEPTSNSSTTVPSPARTVFAIVLADVVHGASGEPVVVDRLVDDSGRLGIDVPTDWADRDTSTGALRNGEGAPHVAASPDLRRFLDGYDAAGLTVVVLPDRPEDALETYRFDDDCMPSDVEDYEGESMTGEYRVWRDCGGTSTDIVTVVADAGRETVLLLAQIRDPADLTALDTALATLTVGDP